MKAITIREPWASLIAAGVKHVETRSWSTSFRGPLAIHAGKKRFGFNSPTAEFVRSLPLDVWRKIPYQHADAELCDNYPLGCIVAVCDLVDVLPVNPPENDRVDGPGLRRFLCRDIGGSLTHYEFSDSHNALPVLRDDDITDQMPYGDFSDCRYGWMVENIRPLHFLLPATGRQGLWDVPTDIAKQIEGAISHDPIQPDVR